MMKLKPLIIFASALFVAIALTIAGKQARLSAQIRAARAEIQLKRAASEAVLNHLEARLAAAKKLSCSQQKNASETSTAASADRRTILAQLNLQEKDPKLQALSLKSNRARSRATYSPLYRQLQLTPAQIASFEEITSQRDEKLQDLTPVARSLGITLNDPAIVKIATEASTDYNTQMKSLLGEPAFLKLQDYERTSWLRQVVGNIAGAATLAGTPFTPEQTEQLIGLLANASPSYVQSGRADTSTVDWEIVDAQARTILSQAQFEAFTTLEGPNNGRYLAKLNSAITAAKKADAERAASAQKN